MSFHHDDEMDELGGTLGDPRRCPRHPHVITSSRDGMIDGLCGICETENDEAAFHDLDGEETTRERFGGAEPEPVRVVDAEPVIWDDDGDIPF